MMTKQKDALKHYLPYTLLIAGIIGLIASMMLTYDKIHVLKDPTYSPPCNINPVLSCGSVMKTEQASLLGVPNTIYGIIGFSGLATVGLVMLAGAEFKRWFWRLLNIGVVGGLVFFLYLYFEAVVRIKAICPYCFVVWMIIPPAVLYVTLYNLREGHIGSRLSARSKSWLLKHHGDILISWYVVILGILLVRFWYYWQTLLP